MIRHRCARSRWAGAVALVAAVVAVAAGGCSDGDDDSAVAVPSASSPAAATATASGGDETSGDGSAMQPASPTPTPMPPSEAPSAETTTVDGAVHLLFEGYPVAPGPFLVPVHRNLPAPGDLRTLLDALAAGPTEEEAAQGLSSALPPGTLVLGVEVADGVATVDLSAEFATGGGSLSMLARAAQIVHTATRAAGVDAVLLRLEGEPLTVLGGEGLVLEGPQTRADHDGLLPPVVVDQPAWGGPWPADGVVAGSAKGGTGPVAWVLVDGDGVILEEGSSPVGANPDRTAFVSEAGDTAAGAASLIVFTVDDDGGQSGVLEYPLSSDD